MLVLIKDTGKQKLQRVTRAHTNLSQSHVSHGTSEKAEGHTQHTTETTNKQTTKRGSNRGAHLPRMPLAVVVSGRFGPSNVNVNNRGALAIGQEREPSA